MLNKSVARRYAEAFFSIAQDTNQIDLFQEELEKIISLIDSTENLKEYLAHLLIPSQDKKEVVDKLFSPVVSATTLNFFKMIIDKRRELYLGLIYDEYRDLADETRNIKKAELISAHDLPEEEVNQLATRLSASMGKTVLLNLTVDPSLLGGIKIRLGDQIIDGTVAKKLEKLKEQLKQVRLT